MNIWIIQTGEPLPFEQSACKMRTALLSEVFVRRGHTVLWWANAYNHLTKRWNCDRDMDIVVNDRLTIKALKGLKYSSNVSLRRYVGNRIIARKFRNVAGQLAAPDAVIASLPAHDFAFEAVEYGCERGIPVFVDVRDPWPDLFLERLPSWLHPFGRLLLASDFAMTRKLFRSASGVIAVSNSFLQWGLQYAGRPTHAADRVFYLGYSPDEDAAGHEESLRPEIQALLVRLERKFVVVYVGTFGFAHDPSDIVSVAQQCKNKDIVYVLCGTGAKFSSLQRAAKTLANVEMAGWLSRQEIRAILRHAHVGICPTSTTMNLFPNKAFSYFSAGLPVVSSFGGDFKEVLERYEIGFTYTPTDVSGLDECILTLYRDRALYRRLSDNVRRVFSEFFHADRIYDEYASHIENVAGENKHYCS